MNIHSFQLVPPLGAGLEFPEFRWGSGSGVVCSQNKICSSLAELPRPLTNNIRISVHNRGLVTEDQDRSKCYLGFLLALLWTEAEPEREVCVTSGGSNVGRSQSWRGLKVGARTCRSFYCRKCNIPQAVLRCFVLGHARFGTKSRSLVCFD